MKQRHILLVDDEKSIRLTLSHQIKKAGYTVTVTESGEKAMEILRSTNSNIDIVLTDLVMDGMDGIQVLKNVKQLRPEVQIMILTCFGSMETVMDALRFGAHDFLVKPCSKEELCLKLAKCVERVELEEALHKSMDNLVASNQKLERLSSIDGLTEIRNSILLIDDDECLRKIVSFYLKKAGFDVTLADNGDLGLMLLKKYTYSLVITDMTMAGMCGLDVIKEIIKINPETNVIVLSGDSDVEMRLKVRSLGVKDYLIKPIANDKLLKKIVDLVK